MLKKRCGAQHIVKECCTGTALVFVMFTVLARGGKSRSSQFRLCMVELECFRLGQSVWVACLFLPSCHSDCPVRDNDSAFVWCGAVFACKPGQLIACVVSRSVRYWLSFSVSTLPFGRSFFFHSRDNLVLHLHMDGRKDGCRIFLTILCSTRQKIHGLVSTPFS